MSAKRALSWLQQGWNVFVDPERETRLERFTAGIHKQLAEQKATFDFTASADRFGVDAEDRPEVGRRLFARCVVKAWSDGDVTEKEHRSLNWIAAAVGLAPGEMPRVMQEHGLLAFSTTLAAAFSDGVLDDSEFAHLDRIAKACGYSAADFFRQQFRSNGEGFIRQLFLKVWEDGRMDQAEWEAIRATFVRLGMDDAAFRDAIRAPAQQLVEHSLADFKSDEQITPDEQQTLEWMLTHLIDDRQFASYVRQEISKVASMAAIRRGTLPSLPAPDGVALRAGEIVHFQSPAVFTWLRRRSGELVPEQSSGLAIITDYRLLFISPGQSLQLPHNSILSYQRRLFGVEIQTSGKGAGAYEFDQNSEFGIEIWISTIGKANQTLVAPQVKDDARKISRDVRQRVWQRHGGRCAECNATNYLEFDHIIPVARGGGNSDNNIQLLCRGCNSKKSDKI